MKYTYYILLVLLFVNCNSENAPDCLQTAGTIVTTEVAVTPFTKVLVWQGIQLFVSQGETYKALLETGENLLPEITLTVIDGQLNLFNNNGCNFLRDFGVTKVYITAPNIQEIRTSSSLPVTSLGVLEFPELTLISEDQVFEDVTHTDGDFNIEIQAIKLNIVANGLSRFYISGQATNANLQFFSGNGSVIAPNLEIQNATVFHRGSANWTINPQQSIRGSIVSVGDIICKNRPPIIDVETPYQGQLIFD